MLEGEKYSARIHFGPRTLRDVPLVGIHELEQVRSSYTPEGLDELATSMILDPEIDDNPEKIASEAFDLSSPIIVARLDEFSARKYVRDHAEHYGIEPIDARSLLSEDGTATILIAGHRRKRALYRLADRFDIDPEDISVTASVRENIRFGEALGLQLRENVHERPPVHDEARAIERFYRDVTRQLGEEPSKKWFATQLGFSETKVRDALAFASLPDEIQSMTERGKLSYSVAKRLRPLQDAYEKLYRYEHESMDDDTLQEWVRHSLVTDAMHLTSDRLKGSETKPRQYIDNKIEAVLSKLYKQEALFELVAEAPKVRRERASRELSQLALRSLEWQAQSGDLKPEAVRGLEALRDKIDALVREARRQAELPTELELDFNTSRQAG